MESQDHSTTNTDLDPILRRIPNPYVRQQETMSSHSSPSLESVDYSQLRNDNRQLLNTLLPAHTTNYPTLTFDDLSFGSEYTATTCESTIHSDPSVSLPYITPIPHSISIAPTTSPLLYHNPRSLGTLDYYYPRRINPNPTQPSNSTTPTPCPLPATDTGTTTTPTPSAPDTHTATNRFHQTTISSYWDEFQASSNEVSQSASWGDTFEVKLDHTVRIYFQNVNSCGLSKSSAKWNHILSSMDQAQCDIMGFAQTSINWKHLHIRERFLTPLRDVMPINRVNLSRNTFHSDHGVLPGGVAQLVRGDWTGRIVEHIHDFRRMGRWCGFKLRLKNDRHLFVISAYRVCSQTKSATGVETAYRQQDFLLSQEGFENPDPRRQFIRDLIKCVKEWQSPMDDILISLDANEALGDSAHGLTALMRECNLIDLFHHHHGVCPNFSTYDGGSKRLDYMIGSSTLLPYISRCGYLEFYKGVGTDHRGLFMDLSCEIIDGLTHLERSPTRHLNSSHPNDVYKYKQHVMQEFLSHQIPQRASDLFSMSGLIKENNKEYIDKLNSLDQLILQIQLSAERQHCKKRTRFDWSDDIHSAKMIVHYWSIRRKRKTRKQNVTKVCNEIYQKLPEAQRQYIDIATGGALNNWLNSKKRLQSLMVQHKKLQEQLKHDILKNEATVKGTTVDKLATQKDRQKKDKRLYSSLKQHFHPFTRSGISHIILPDKDASGLPTEDVDLAATWRTETNPQIVLDKIYHRNISHFGQAQGTPFTTPPLQDKFGYSGMSHSGLSLIQDGELPSGIDTIDQPAKDILTQLQTHSPNQVIYHDLISFAGFTKAIRKWREATSTSPSGKHLGHYKSLISIDSNASKYTEAIPDPGPSILEVLYHVAVAAFNSGITLQRWTNVTTCMIEKLPGIPKLNKLRVIHLYEADYNVLNKLIWQRGIVWEAHKTDRLHPAQAGSRPYHTSIEVVMSKSLKYMYSSLTRTAMATMDNDAKSCYDRIVASLALLISHQYGVPEQYCKTVGDTLRQMQFHIRTAMGDSDQSYCHSSETPIHGVGQGGTASPAFWLLVSSVLFECYQNKATGMTMTDPSGNLSIHQWLEAIVDDTSLFTNLVQNNDVAQLVSALEKDAQNWELYLSASGGCLELTKCFYYVLAWTFSITGDAMPMTTDEINSLSPPIQLKEYGKTHSTPIASKHPSEAHKTLGVWKTMTGDVSEQIKVLSQRSQNMANIVATSGIYPYQADVAMRMIYAPSMGYCLPAVSIPEKTLDRIQYKALESFVPALGFNKGFPRDIILGPTAYGGEGIPHLHTESKLQQLEILIMHIRANTDLGISFRINLNWLQLTLGLSVPLFMQDKAVIGVHNWYTELHKFLLSINSKLRISDTVVPRVERIHDHAIMDVITGGTIAVSKNQIRTIINWRLFFQVQLLSDLTNAAGDSIDDIYLTYPTAASITLLRSDRTTKSLWPQQPPPSSLASFQLWTRCIRQCFLEHKGNKLRQPLGPWLSTVSSSQSRWHAYLDPTYTTLYHRTSQGTASYTSIISRTTRTITLDTTMMTETTDIPQNCIPVDIVIRDSTIVVHHNKSKRIHPLDTTFPPPTNIEEAIRSAPKWQHRLLQHFRIYDLQLMLDTIQQPSANIKLLMVSDGGLQDYIGSFGVAISTMTQSLCQIEGPVSGSPYQLTSFRSEAYGMLAGITFIHLLISSHDLHFEQTRTIHLYCDNLALVTWVQKIIAGLHYPRMYLKSEADVLMQIQHEIRILKQRHNIIFDLAHVKGHQDDHTPYADLSRPAQLNIDADSYATNYLLQHGPQFDYDDFPANPVTMYINDALNTRDHKRQIRQASRSPALRKYMIAKFSWKPSVPDMIWWQVHGSSISSFPSNDRRRIRKFIFNWLPTCERLNLQDRNVSAECSSCHNTIETHRHLFTCPCAHRGTIKDTWFKKLKEFFANDKYAPRSMTDIFYNMLAKECLNTPPPPLPELPPSITSAYSDQSHIGWDQLLRGRLAFRWGTIIATHLSVHHIPEKEMTALIWGRNFIKLAFHLAIDLWNCRNKIAHEPNERNESKLTRQRTLSQIEALQQSNPEIRSCDRHFLYQPLAVLETYSLCSLLSWHRQAQIMVRNQKKYISRQPDIRNAFAGRNVVLQQPSSPPGALSITDPSRTST